MVDIQRSKPGDRGRSDHGPLTQPERLHNFLQPLHVSQVGRVCPTVVTNRAVRLYISLRCKRIIRYEDGVPWGQPLEAGLGEQTVENRRRAERESAHWMGRCHIEGEPSEVWRECAIIDVSTLGVGIDLCYPDAVELLGLWQDGEIRLQPSRRITLGIEQLGPSLPMTVAGEVRNAGSGPDGIIRAGIEFVGLTEAERRQLGCVPEPV